MVNLPGKRKKILDVVFGGFGRHITDSYCVDRPLRLIPHRQPNPTHQPTNQQYHQDPTPTENLRSRNPVKSQTLATPQDRNTKSHRKPPNPSLAQPSPSPSRETRNSTERVPKVQQKGWKKKGENTEASYRHDDEVGLRCARVGGASDEEWKLGARADARRRKARKEGKGRRAKEEGRKTRIVRPWPSLSLRIIIGAQTRQPRMFLPRTFQEPLFPRIPSSLHTDVGTTPVQL